MTDEEMRRTGWRVEKKTVGQFTRARCVNKANKWETRSFINNPRDKDFYNIDPVQAAKDAARDFMDKMKVHKEEQQRQLELLHTYLNPVEKRKAA